MTTEATALLTKTRSGLEWLRRNHNAYVDGQVGQHSDEDFSRILGETDLMERGLRDGGLKGCILEVGPCPEGAVITCDACAGIIREESTREGETTVLGEEAEPPSEPVGAETGVVESKSGAETVVDRDADGPAEGPDRTEPTQMGLFPEVSDGRH